ncbi:hypothetical protein [Pseudobacteriovorax antillogorgiicola]|nr:hypothetical protein [Pseudobacteriovorax antillogorgiicola]
MSHELDSYELEVLRDRLSQGVTRASQAIQAIVSKQINLSLPEIKLVRCQDDSSEVGEPQELMSYVSLGFEGGLSGTATIEFTRKSAMQLVRKLVPNAGDGSQDLDVMGESTITEIGNIVLNAVMGTTANFFSLDLKYFVPQYHHDQESILKGKDGTETMLLFIETFLIVEDKEIEGRILVRFRVDGVRELLENWFPDKGLKYA